MKKYFIVQQFPVQIAGINTNEVFTEELKAIERAEEYAIKTGRVHYVVQAIIEISPKTSNKRLKTESNL